MIPLYVSLPKKGLLQLKQQFNFFMIAKYFHSPHNVAVNRGLGDRKKRYMPDCSLFSIAIIINLFFA